MKQSRKLFFEKLISTVDFEFFNGGEARLSVGNKQNKSLIIRPFDIFSQLTRGRETKIYFLRDNKVFTLHEGDAFYSPAGLPRQGSHLSNKPRIIRFSLCRFNFSGNLRLPNFFPEPVFIPADKGGIEIGEICVKLQEVMNSSEDPFRRAILIRKLAMELLLNIAKNARINEKVLSSFSAPESPCLKVLDYLGSHYQQVVQVDELARLACLSVSRFHRVFKAFTGLSPGAYLIKLRLNKAQEQLLMTDMSISAIAESVGWPDGFYFSRIFHAKLGIPPSQYRKQKNLFD